MIEAKALPVDPPQARHPRAPLHAQQADGQHVTDLQPDGVGQLRIDRDQRLAPIAGRPPFARHQRVALGQCVRIGQASFAAQRPGILGQLLQFGHHGRVGGRPVGQDRAAQGGHRLDHGTGDAGAHNILEGGEPVAGHVERKVVGGAVGHAAPDIGVKAGLHRRQQDEGRQAEAERGDQRGGGRAGAMQIGERRARDRSGRARRPCGQPPDQPAEPGQQRQQRRRAGQEQRGQLRLRRTEQRQRHDAGKPQPHRPCGRAPVARQRRHPRAHQRHRRHVARAQQRRRGEHQHHQQPEQRRAQQRRSIDHQPGPDRQQIAQRAGQQRRHQHARRQPRQRSGQRGRADLQRIDARDVAAGRPQDLQGGDAGPPRLQVGGDTTADPDPRDHQRGKAHQSQELTHPPDEPLGARRGTVAGGDVEAGIGKAGLQRLLHRLRVGGPGKAHPRLGLVHRSGRDQPGPLRQVERHDHRLAELEALAQPVRLLGDDPADGQVRAADADAVAGAHPQPLGRARCEPCLARRRSAHPVPAIERQRAVERPIGIHRLQLDRRGGLAGAGGGLHPQTLRDGAVAFEEGGLVPGQRALPHLDLEIAAQQHLPLRIQLAPDRRCQRADRGQRPDAQEQAHQQQAQAPEPPVEVAPRDPPRRPPVHRRPFGCGAARCALSHRCRRRCGRRRA